ncbi:MAG: nitroreductase family protein [Salinivirgaceae bacterium]|jgi:nitroreductase/NAD-dependent dihydropyrimidine dehydrogenase PreA subunit|nr:nitroreductase family protein [Salinivirgaceae bacterium]
MPTIELDKCIKCLKCVNDCPSNAIDIERGIIDNSCIHCGHCVAICPESTIYPDTGEIQKLQSSTVLPVDFQNLSANTRTCRSFISKEVAHETLQLLIENMKHYPSASNSRPIEITIVKSKEIIQRLNDQTANGLIKMLRFITSPILKPILKAFVPKFNITGLDNYKKKFISRQIPESSQVCHHAPLVMLFHAPVTKFGMASADSYIWATYTSIFAQTLGLGTCFNGFIVKAMERSKVMRKEFSIPANHQVYAALLIGYPKVKYINEVGREKPNMNTV